MQLRSPIAASIEYALNDGSVAERSAIGET
jgi:hypothetical protein